MARLNVIFFIVIAFLISGCVTASKTRSHVDPALLAGDIQMITQDVTEFLEEHLPPAHTIIAIDPPKINNNHDALTQSLLPALQEKGYGIKVLNTGERDATDTAVHVRYLVSQLDDGVLLRLQFQGKEASRHYPRDESGQLAIGAPFMVRGDE